ncbi:hypothetical protein MRY87_13345 [bacterium]|nr:hypothetical protein [bacterium]
MSTSPLPVESFEIDTFLRGVVTRRNVALTVRVLRVVLLITLFLIVVLNTRFIVNELFGPSSSLEAIQRIVPQGPVADPADAAQLKEQFNRKDARIIRETALFGITTKPTVAQPTQKKPEAPKETPLPFGLVGTFVSGTGNSVAIIEEEKKKVQEVFAVGEEVFELATLKSVHASYVELDRDGKREILSLDEGSTGGGDGAAPEGAEEIVVDENELTSALDNLPLLLTQARAVPYFKEGKSVGLRLFAIKTGSLYDKIGLKNGDILKTINGKNLGDFSQAMKLFEQLREERNLTLQLERNRKPSTYYYRIE